MRLTNLTPGESFIFERDMHSEVTPTRFISGGGTRIARHCDPARFQSLPAEAADALVVNVGRDFDDGSRLDVNHQVWLCGSGLHDPLRRVRAEDLIRAGFANHKSWRLLLPETSELNAHIAFPVSRINKTMLTIFDDIHQREHRFLPVFLNAGNVDFQIMDKKRSDLLPLPSGYREAIAFFLENESRFEKALSLLDAESAYLKAQLTRK